MVHLGKIPLQLWNSSINYENQPSGINSDRKRARFVWSVRRVGQWGRENKEQDSPLGWVSSLKQNKKMGGRNVRNCFPGRPLKSGRRWLGGELWKFELSPCLIKLIRIGCLVGDKEALYRRVSWQKAINLRSRSDAWLPLPMRGFGKRKSCQPG